jgi:hypothetical protein
MTEHEQAQLREYLGKLERVGFVVQGETPSGLLAVGSPGTGDALRIDGSCEINPGREAQAMREFAESEAGQAHRRFIRDLEQAREALEPRACPRKLGTFAADVYLLDTLTGERAVYRSIEYVDNDGEWSPYVWEEGNFSCDCNRGIFFEQVSPVIEDDAGPLEHPCGEGRYRVEQIIDLRDGATLYAETV